MLFWQQFLDSSGNLGSVVHPSHTLHWSIFLKPPHPVSIGWDRISVALQMNPPFLAYLYSISSQKSQWIRIHLALSNTDLDILIALRFVLVFKPCDKETSPNIPVSIICFYTLLLEVSQHDGGACRGFASPLATSLSLSVPAQGVAFSCPGARRQRQRMHLFYDSRALPALAEGLCSTRAQLSKLGRPAAGSWSLPVHPRGVGAWAPPLLSRPSWRACPYRQEQDARASPGVLMEGRHPGGTAARGAVPRPVPWEASVSHRPAHTQTPCGPHAARNKLTLLAVFKNRL